MFAKNQILYSPGGLALKTNLRGPLPGRVWLLFFFILKLFFLLLSLNILDFTLCLAERSLGHAGPRLSNSMIHNCLFRETKINFCDKKKKNIRGNDVLI